MFHCLSHVGLGADFRPER